jgi:hypothetical protein
MSISCNDLGVGRVGLLFQKKKKKERNLNANFETYLILRCCPHYQKWLTLQWTIPKDNKIPSSLIAIYSIL